MIGDVLVFSFAVRGDLRVEWLFAVFGTLVLVNLLKWYKRRV